MASEPLLEAENLTIQYETADGMLTAVSNATFSIERAEYFGLVGESGCGKSTMAKAIMGALDSNGEIASGTIRYDGQEIQSYDERQLNEDIRWKEISYIPQSSMNSLDPLQTVEEQAAEIATVHGVDEAEAIKRFKELFEIVGLHEDRISDYPHQFSGGMEQRAIIALSLLLDPTLIIADEPTTALDVIMQDQIFKYLDEVKQMDTSMLLITHDISLVFESCDSMAIMHGGQVAESGDTVEVFESPRHPYSIMLQGAFPDVRRPGQELDVIEGQPPQSIGEVSTCTFVDRCPWASEECEQSEPPLEGVDSQTTDGRPHIVGCVNQEEVARDRQGNRPAADIPPTEGRDE